LFSSVRQVAPGILLIVHLMADLRQAFLRQHAERLVDAAKPSRTDSVVSKPLG